MFFFQDLTYLVEKSLEMVKKMEKRLLQFTETSMKHLEGLDGLDIIGELTSATQVSLKIIIVKM